MKNFTVFKKIGSKVSKNALLSMKQKNQQK